MVNSPQCARIHLQLSSESLQRCRKRIMLIDMHKLPYDEYPSPPSDRETRPTDDQGIMGIWRELLRLANGPFFMMDEKGPCYLESHSKNFECKLLHRTHRTYYITSLSCPTRHTLLWFYYRPSFHFLPFPLLPMLASQFPLLLSLFPFLWHPRSLRLDPQTHRQRPLLRRSS